MQRSDSNVLRFLCCTLALCGLLLTAGPSAAETLERDFPFELDTWYDLDVEDGPVTLHRIRVASIEGNFKSRVFRPGTKKDGMVQDVQIQVEYSNDSTNDINAELEIFWLDAEGRRIDGYAGDEDMDEEERRSKMTALRSTLVYGLEVAKTLSVKILF